jgi:hypothetical protein
MLLFTLAAGATLAQSANRAARRPAAPPRSTGSAAIDAALDAPSETEPAMRLREGTLLTDQRGTFQLTGQRITFCPQDGQHTFCVLENLAAERIWRVMGEAQRRVFRVSGVVTEYRGSNYLLLKRVILTGELAEPPDRS